jgi:hypothetical protein
VAAAIARRWRSIIERAPSALANEGRHWRVEPAKCQKPDEKAADMGLRGDKNMRRYWKDSWLGNLDSNHDWRSQSPRFWRLKYPPPERTVGEAENGIQPHGSSFFGIRGRIDVMAHAADETATFGQSGGMAWPTGHQATGPPMATFLFASGPIATH